MLRAAINVLLIGLVAVLSWIGHRVTGSGRKKYFMMKTSILLGILTFNFGVSATIPLLLQSANAAESVQKQAADEGTDFNKDTKKNVRKLKQKVRKATGKDTVVKDAKDQVQDMGDNANAAIEKAKR